jgi:hypothetical protein
MLILLVRRDKPGGLFADGSSARLRVSHPPDLSHAWFSFNQTLQRLRSSKGRRSFSLCPKSGSSSHKEQHAVVREGDFAGFGDRFAAHKAGIGKGVMRRAERITAPLDRPILVLRALIRPQ